MKLDDINDMAYLIEDGEKIAAIKMFRALTGMPLKESKDWVVGVDGRQPVHMFLAKTKAAYIKDPAVAMADLVTEMHSCVERMNEILAEFAALADSMVSPETDATDGADDPVGVAEQRDFGTTVMAILENVRKGK